MDLGHVLLGLVIVLAAIVVVWLILWRLYARSSSEVALVRTGFLGQKVAVNRGVFVIPVLHALARISMSTLRLEVQREREQSLITRDRLRVDMTAVFYVRVQRTREAVARAAQSFGQKFLKPDAAAELLEGKFVGALRAAAAEMTMEELHEQRQGYVERVDALLVDSLATSGLELESVALTRLDQTSREYFSATNAFDAAGLTKLTAEIEERRRRRTEIEQDAQVAIQQKHLETERRLLEIQREEEYARLEQERQIAIRRAEQAAEIARHQAERKREAEEAEIQAGESTDRTRVVSERTVREERIESERRIRALEIEQARAVEIAEVEKRKLIELAEQEREVAVAEQSRLQSDAQARAERSRADAVRAAEAVITTRELERAERTRATDLVAARSGAERDEVARVGAASTEQAAAEHRARAIKTLADAEAAAEALRARATEIRHGIEAAARRALNEAENVLSPDAQALRLRLAVVEHLEAIVRESVKPLQQIEGIKIIQVDGLTGGGRGGIEAPEGVRPNLAEQIVNSALRYRGQAPLVDALLKEIGLAGGDVNGLTRALGALSGQVPEPIRPAAEDDRSA